MRKVSTLLLLIVALTTCIGCDQITKDFARDNLMYGAPVTIVEDLVHLVYAENSGIAFGIGAELSETTRFWLFNVGVLAVLMTITVVAYRRRGQGALFLAGATLIIAGGVSNLIDRFINEGHVVDFVVLDLGGFRSIVFNFADVLVMCGAGLLVVSAFRVHARQQVSRPLELS